MQRFTFCNLLVIILLAIQITCYSQQADKVMVVVIDGARYTETFGDPSYTYIPRMKELATQGTIISNFKNDGYTYTSRAIPALWCGAWTGVQSITYNGASTQFTNLPSIFEYYRKQKDMPANECFYILKYISSLWLPSFDDDYGQEYWPTFNSTGSTDRDVANQTQQIIDSQQPHFLWVYLADVDAAGHSGNWNQYTRSIEIADSIVGVLWDRVQAHPFYQNTTTLLVTNDHGRHDDQHGGFKGHGCTCNGCRQIQFLAVGPDIKQNFVSSQPRVLPDFAVTASYILGINPEKSTGNVMHEIFNSTSVKQIDNSNFALLGSFPNPFSESTRIRYTLSKTSKVKLSVYSVTGALVSTLVSETQNEGEHSVIWNGYDAYGNHLPQGVYILRLVVDRAQKSIAVVRIANK